MAALGALLPSRLQGDRRASLGVIAHGGAA
jgi:hypothetical protein